jgi:hypothetical protein
MCHRIKSGENRIDPCLVDVINLLRSKGINTVACCCGHDRYSQSILVKNSDGVVYDYQTKTYIPRKRRFYKRDSDGYLFVPELASDHSK